MIESDTKSSPMMVQWQECKAQAKDAIVLFRLGDFYEAFYEDAKICSQELDLTLTKRQTVPMSGIPSHTVDGYVEKLVAKGYRVAIAEQLEDARSVKGLVKRGITRIVTPGTIFNASYISEKSNNYIASLNLTDGRFGIAFLDVTCLECRVIETNSLDEAFAELTRFCPSELIASLKLEEKYSAFFSDFKKQKNCRIDFIEPWRFDLNLNLGFLTRHYKVHSLDGFGLKEMHAAVNAAGALLSYVQDNLRLSLESISPILPYTLDSFLRIDPTTMRHLELVESMQTGSRKNTLLYILDHTQTPMGGRLLKRWILQPLLNVEKIVERQDAVEEILLSSSLMDSLVLELSFVRDVERLMSRILSGYGSPKDLVALKCSLEPIDKIKELLDCVSVNFLKGVNQKLKGLPNLIDLISRALVDDPPLRLSDGQVFRSGYNDSLDLLRQLSDDSKGWMADYQNQIREETGIKTLKVGFTRISGFFIEASKGQADKVPLNFHRRQTLTNAERFVTPELKAYEEKIVNAEEKMAEIEAALFCELKQTIISHADTIFENGNAIAQLDCILSLAMAAKKQRYTKPQVMMDNTLDIVDGRHPIVEASHLQEKFIPNDTKFDYENERLMVITGPNMAGKSTYIRQVALIVIMAQVGSFVPAAQAKIGIVDKVFSRVGASDDLSRGMSTFMVEMAETAAILHHATDRSLVVLDEIGRGTSTYDGISLAWSIAEYLLTALQKQAKTLFATHYWELTKMEGKIKGAVNYNVAVLESGDQILFLRKIVKGGTDKSYGIHVARLAGLPLPVLERAQEILLHLEENSNQKSAFEPPKNKRVLIKKTVIHPPEIQLSLL